MSTRMLSRIAVTALLVMIAAVPAQAYIPYDTHVMFLDMATKDMLRLLPRAMGSYIYQKPLRLHARHDLYDSGNSG